MFVCLVFSASGWAAASTIVGIWSVPIEAGKDKGKERSHIEIFEKNGLYYGKNVKLNNAPANLLCRKCKSEKKISRSWEWWLSGILKRNQTATPEEKFWP